MRRRRRRTLRELASFPAVLWRVVVVGGAAARGSGRGGFWLSAAARQLPGWLAMPVDGPALCCALVVTRRIRSEPGKCTAQNRKNNRKSAD